MKGQRRHHVSWVALTTLDFTTEGYDTLRLGAGWQQAVPCLGFHSPSYRSPMIPLNELLPGRQMASRAALERGLIGHSQYAPPWRHTSPLPALDRSGQVPSPAHFGRWGLALGLGWGTRPSRTYATCSSPCCP